MGGSYRDLESEITKKVLVIVYVRKKEKRIYIHFSSLQAIDSPPPNSFVYYFQRCILRSAVHTNSTGTERQPSDDIGPPPRLEMVVWLRENKWYAVGCG